MLWVRPYIARAPGILAARTPAISHYPPPFSLVLSLYRFSSTSDGAGSCHPHGRCAPRRTAAGLQGDGRRATMLKRQPRTAVLGHRRGEVERVRLLRPQQYQGARCLQAHTYTAAGSEGVDSLSLVHELGKRTKASRAGWALC